MTLATKLAAEMTAVKCELAKDVLRSSGYLNLRVTGWSMLPTIWPGDTLVIGRVCGDDVSEGDIVLFVRNNKLVAHRVIGKGDAPAGSRILTRGDAISRPDSPLSNRDLLGRVSFILRSGRRIEPRKVMRASERAVANLLQHSKTGARLVAGVYDRFRTSAHQNSSNRTVPCQS